MNLSNIEIVSEGLEAGARVITALVKGKEIKVSRAVIKERADVCARCTHNRGGRCEICGCYLNLKQMLTTEGCPKGYWKS